MRVSSYMIFGNLTRSLQKDMETYSALNERLASGKRISKPSDDILGTSRAIDYKLSISTNDQFRRNMEAASSRLTFTSTAMTSFSSTITSLRSLLSQSLMGAQDPTLRQSYALQADQFRQMLMDLANTKLGDNYLFSGYRSDQQPYTAAAGYLYQGDSGVMNVPVDRSSALPINVTGDAAFSYSLSAPVVNQISGGRFVHYTQGAGTTVNVEIRDANDTAVLDTFSFSNAIQIADIMTNAIAGNDRARLEALADPLSRTSSNLQVVINDIGGRLEGVKARSSRLQNDNNIMLTAVSAIEDADPVQTAAELKKVEVTLQALHESASRVMSQSLLDFLR